MFYQVYKCKLCDTPIVLARPIEAEIAEDAVQKADKVYMHQCLARIETDITKRYGIAV